MNALRDSVKSLAQFLRHHGRGDRSDALALRPGRDGATIPGREQLIRRILGTIHNNSILLLGDSGIGKTSVLLELRDGLGMVESPSHVFFPVYIDMRHVPERQLFAAVADAILRQLTQPSGRRRVMGTAPGRTGYDHRDLARDVRGVIRALGRTSRKQIRLVLLVDGIDEINTYDPRTAQKVRSLFMAGFSENLVMVASAIEIDRRWEQEGSPWYNFFEEIRLHAIDGGDETLPEVRDTMTRDE